MSNFANVYTGTAPNDLTGDPLRNAFNKINNNFANIAAGTTGAVSSVAGRTGNIVLTVNDVAGAASNVYAKSYTMGNTEDWNTAPTTVAAALDEIAARLRAANI